MLQFNAFVIERFKLIPEKYPQFDKLQYQEYIIRSIKLCLACFLNDSTIQDEVTILGLNEVAVVMEDIEFVYPGLKDAQLTKDYYDYIQLIKKRIQTKIECDEKESKFLFNKAVIENIDRALRSGNWIDSESVPLIDILESNSWYNNLFTINWRREQQSLVYFFYILNEKKRDIPMGSITELISQNFLVKGERKTPTQLSKSLSNYFSDYEDKKRREKPQEIMDLDAIYKRCSSK